MNVIKMFIDRLEKATMETWVAILKYIDGNIDDHERRLNKIEEYERLGNLEKRVDDLEKSHNNYKMKVDNDAENRKFWKRTFFTAVVGVVVGYLATQMGFK